MIDDRGDFRRITIGDLLFWTWIFRGFGLAREPKKIALGMVGVLTMSLGYNMIGSFLPSEEPAKPAATASEVEQNDYRWKSTAYHASRSARLLPWQAREDSASEPSWLSLPSGIYLSPLRNRPEAWTDLGIHVPASAFLVLEPLRALTLPAKLIFAEPASAGLGLLLLVWMLAVWALFGAAICRITSVQLAKNRSLSGREAIGFVLSRYVTFFSAPVLPFLGVVLIVIASLLGGLLLWLPGVNVVAGALWFLPIAAGIVIFSALLGLLLGWPLMHAAIATESTESFDALSRSFSYVLGRPWNYVFYIAVAIVYGAACTTFATAAADGIVHLSRYAISWSYSSVGDLYAYAPAAAGWATAPSEPLAGSERIVGLLVGFWTHVLFLGLVGFVYAFFWSEVTVIYFLLRRDVDETDMEEVFIDEENDEPFPTATPIVPGPKPTVAPPTTSLGPGASLPIVDPPRSS